MPTGLSVEWARIEPEPGRFDQNALDTYRRMLEALAQPRASSRWSRCTISPTRPGSPIAAAGATPTWCRASPHYADRVARQLGDLVTLVGDHQRAQHPGPQGLHRRQLAAAPAVGPARLHPPAAACRAGARRWRAGRSRRNGLRRMASMAFALWPMQAAALVEPDRPVDGSAGRLAVAGPRAAPHAAGARLDRRQLLQPQRWSAGHGRERRRRTGERTDFGWEIYPQGLYDVLRRVGGYGKPVVITENGIADADDDQRPAYLVAHLRQIQRAISDGVDVRGYMHWSLLDNFEWAEGYTQKFGLATRRSPASAPAPRRLRARSPGRTTFAIGMAGRSRARRLRRAVNVVARAALSR